MVMRRLRDETASLHASVEEMFNPDVRFATRGNYIQLLHRLHPFYLKCETVLGALPWHEIGFDLDERRKEHLMAADLLAMGESVSDDRPDSHCPICIDLAAGFGTMYVLEGATLGGRILRRSLRNKLGIGRDNGGSFYDCYGDRTERLWKEFGAAAEGYCGSSTQRQTAAIAAATATFTAIGRLLQ